MKKKIKPATKSKPNRQQKEDFNQAAFRAVQETARISESIGATKGQGIFILNFSIIALRIVRDRI
jgi:hypothetical protein